VKKYEWEIKKCRGTFNRMDGCLDLCASISRVPLSALLLGQY